MNKQWTDVLDYEVVIGGSLLEAVVPATDDLYCHYRSCCHLLPRLRGLA